MYKRVLSFVLALVTVCTAALYSVSAYDPLPEEELHAQELKQKCAEALRAYVERTEEYVEEVYIGFAVECGEYIVFRGYWGGIPAMQSFQLVGDYWLYDGGIAGDENSNPTGTYTLDAYGNIRSLYDVYYDSFIDMEAVFEAIPDNRWIYLRGDIDSDRQLTVKDTTLVQKYLAKIPEAMDTVYKHWLGYKVMDFDLSSGTELFSNSIGKVDVKDVTAIQKRLAGITAYKHRPADFDENSIIVFVSDETKEYTLDDFPGGKFESVEKHGDNWYVLNLKTPGEENVIDAVNSLWSRVGDDLTSVSANYIEIVECE